VAETAPLAILVPRQASGEDWRCILSLADVPEVMKVWYRIRIITTIPGGSAILLGEDCIVDGQLPDPGRFAALGGEPGAGVEMQVMGMAEPGAGAVLVLDRPARLISMGRDAALKLASRLCAAVATAPGRN
jgi:hypothetical protein